MSSSCELGQGPQGEGGRGCVMDPNLTSRSRERIGGVGGCLSSSYELGRVPQGEGGRGKVREPKLASRGREREGGTGKLFEFIL